MELIDILNGLTPFATLALIVYLWVQGRNKHTDKDDTLKLELVKLVGAAVSNIEQSTEALKALRTAEMETQTLISGTRRELANHHGAVSENHALVLAAVEAVPEKAARKTDAMLAPRFEVVQKLLTTANNMITTLAADVSTATPSTHTVTRADAETPEAQESSADASAVAVEQGG